MLRERLSDFRVRSKLFGIEDPTERIFSEIYFKNTWGGRRGEFYSGGGSRKDVFAAPYVARLTALANEFGFSNMAAVDLGCGDMSIGSRVCDLFSSYVGVDICSELIKRHHRHLESPKISFQKLNIVTEPLPQGDVCMVRQVLQHLSNEQISKILSKLDQYKYVIITEHIPEPGPDVVMNADLAEGAGIRLDQKSGVFLNAPPFNIDENRLTTVLEIPGAGGILKTVLYRPSAKKYMEGNG